MNRRFGSFISFFYPQVIAKAESPVNGHIEVVKHLGSNRIVIDNLSQSGGLVTNLWQAALTQAKAKHFFNRTPQTCLILGFGGGTAAGLIHRFWPNTHITGIELDPLMVELGNKYLTHIHLGIEDVQIPGLNIVIGDAFRYMNTNHTQYDLILIDLYRGRQIPNQATGNLFLNQLKQALALRGAVIFNYLTLTGQEPQARDFYQHLATVFTHVTRLHTLSNWLLLASDSLE